MTGPVPLVRAIPRIPGVWRGKRAHDVAAVPTGIVDLDRVLPGGGLPLGALTEVVPLAEGVGELSLLVPVLRARMKDRRLLIVRPPHILCPQALVNAGVALSRLVWIGAGTDEDGRWAAEQALRSGACAAVLVWTDTRADTAIRRLQIAAAETEGLAIVYRPPVALRNSSPAAVRLALHPSPRGARIEVIKCRGGHAGVSIPLGHRVAA